MRTSADPILNLDEIHLLLCGVRLDHVIVNPLLSSRHNAAVCKCFADFIIRNESLRTGIRHPFRIKFPHWKHQLV